MEPRHIKGVLFDAFGTLCRIESPRLPYRLLMRQWCQGAGDSFQAIMLRDATLSNQPGLPQTDILSILSRVFCWRSVGTRFF
jgi:hypothetical protein